MILIDPPCACLNTSLNTNTTNPLTSSLSPAGSLASLRSPSSTALGSTLQAGGGRRAGSSWEFFRSGEEVGELKRTRGRCWIEIVFHGLRSGQGELSHQKTGDSLLLYLSWESGPFPPRPVA